MYYYYISSKNTYGITNLEKYEREIEEDYDKRVKNTSNEKTSGNTYDKQERYNRNSGITQNTVTSERNDKLFRKNRFTTNKNNANNTNSIENKQKELDNSSFRLLTK